MLTRLDQNLDSGSSLMLNLLYYWRIPANKMSPRLVNEAIIHRIRYASNAMNVMLNSWRSRALLTSWPFRFRSSPLAIRRISSSCKKSSSHWHLVVLFPQPVEYISFTLRERAIEGLFPEGIFYTKSWFYLESEIGHLVEGRWQHKNCEGTNYQARSIHDLVHLEHVVCISVDSIQAE